MVAEPKWGQLATCEEIFNQIKGLNIGNLSPLEQSIALENWFNYNIFYIRNSNNELSIRPDANEHRPRYVYSTVYGWVDFLHVFRIVRWCIESVDPQNPLYNWQLQQLAENVELKGYGGEIKQWLDGHESAFSYEDLCSNHIGAMLFVNNYEAIVGGQISWDQVLSNACGQLKFAKPSDAPNYKYIPHILDENVPHIYSATSSADPDGLNCLVGDNLKNIHRDVFCKKSLRTMLNIMEAHAKFPH